MGTEIWKPAKGFEEYEISNHGRIRNRAGRIMRTSENGVGYFKFGRKRNGEYKSEYIHRLVAFAFVPNPGRKPCVNHIDCDPSNNHADNLEWCTKAENTAHMVKLGRNKRTAEWIEHLNEGLDFMRKPVIGTSIKTGNSIVFNGINEVKTRGFQPSCVCNCCNHKAKQHKGYTWRYV